MQVESAALSETPEQIYLRVFRQLRPRSPLPEVRIEFCRFANADSYVRIEERRLSVRMADVLAGAPTSVMEALANILLSKLFRKPVPKACHHRYRLFLNRKDVRRHLHLVRQIRGRKFLSGPQGEHHNLVDVFEELNRRYFHGLMARPELSWSRGASRSVLGHYDPSHNAIIISRLLDRAGVPRLALEYVLFHEMLHLRFPAEHAGSKRRVHTWEFREAEKTFPELKAAKQILKAL